MLAAEAGAHHDRIASINLDMHVPHGGTEIVTLHAGSFGAMAKADYVLDMPSRQGNDMSRSAAG